MKILKLARQNYKRALREAIKKIQEGKVLVCPTDTVYGLVCDAASQKAAAKLFKIKRRPAAKPIPIFVKDIKMAKELAYVDKKQEKFLKKVWPGKTTVVLTRLRQGSRLRPSGFGGQVGGQRKKKLYGVDKGTIALRTPKYKFISDLLRELNRPLTGTSANISGLPASTRIREVISQFKRTRPQPDLILDAGDLPPSEPSTVADFSGKKIQILRKGEIKLCPVRN